MKMGADYGYPFFLTCQGYLSILNRIWLTSRFALSTPHLPRKNATTLIPLCQHISVTLPSKSRSCGAQ